MNKTTKGALAAATAGVLLLGGAGSLAYWSDSDTVDGSAFNAGSLNLDPVEGDLCNVWNLDTGEPGGQPFVPGTDKLVPGDVVTKVCTFTVDAVGTHLRAGVEAVPGTNSGALLPDLTVAATALEIDDDPITEITEANDGDVLSVTVSVTFNAASDNDTQTLAAVLDDIDIVTSQLHS
jgi:alternate signal-mediated exported protein